MFLASASSQPIAVKIVLENSSSSVNVIIIVFRVIGLIKKICQKNLVTGVRYEECT